MNVFEDLVLELKQENLLEHTFVDDELAIDTTDEPNPREETGDGDDVVVDDGSVTDEPVEGAAENGADDFEIVSVVDDEQITGEPAEGAIPKTAAARKAKHGREFFNKRAVSEVSSLQMVEHVLTGVEREYVKIVPKPFDDFNAKKALNNFLQISENSNSEEHKSAEFELMTETENWCSTLAERDRNIPVSSLRQYCENSRPALSSQALLALGRFYRNSPYSETVRGKFDFVITRLFSRAGDDDRRVCLFARDEMLGHITKLYAEWSSVPLYTADSDESNLLLTALSFEDLAAEAENAANFDDLITSDFFGRLRLFKESISELFYAPNVTAAAIDCNIRIGNAYVDLIGREHAKLDGSSIQAKYGDLNDQSVSDAAGRTLDLAEIIRQRDQPVVIPDTTADETAPSDVDERTGASKPESKPEHERGSSAFTARIAAQFKAINKWVLVTATVMVLLCAGLGIWVNFYAVDTVSTSGVRAVALETSPLSDHLKSAKVSGDTFYGLLQPSWDILTKEKRTEFLQKALATAQQQGARQVQLIGKDGKIAAYASATRIDVVMP